MKSRRHELNDIIKSPSKPSNYGSTNVSPAKVSSTAYFGVHNENSLIQKQQPNMKADKSQTKYQNGSSGTYPNGKALAKDDLNKSKPSLAKARLVNNLAGLGGSIEENDVGFDPSTDFTYKIEANKTQEQIPKTLLKRDTINQLQYNRSTLHNGITAYLTFKLKFIFVPLS